MSEKELVALLQTRFPESFLGQEYDGNEWTLRLSPTQLARVGEFLRDEPEAQYQLLVTLTGVKDEVHYQLVSLSKHRRLRLCVQNHPPPDSLSLIWPAANWAEREANDLWDVAFAGHPNPAPLLLQDEPPEPQEHPSLCRQ